MDKIGLFPLNMVLFPESVISLHIFEERYKRLINDAIKSNIPFGINLSTPKLHDIGCTAEVTKMIRRYEDGKMDVMITGLKRFRLLHFKEGESMYYIAEVSYFDDELTNIDKYLITECVDKYNNIISTIGDINLEKIEVSKLDTAIPSFYLAQKSGFTLEQRQVLLEMTSENMRLEMIRYHLNKVLPIAKEAELIRKLIQNDGYFQPKFYNP
jgi:Lon protease-like protein